MGKIITRIPDGHWCSDNNMECIYVQHSRGEDFCHLYRHYLNAEFNDENIKVCKKCEPCINVMNRIIELSNIELINESESER